MRGLVVILGMLGLGAVSLSADEAEFRTFTNDFGDSVEAKLLELKKDEGSIRIQLRNGRKMDAKLSAFSQDDQKYIREWWKGVVTDRRILHESARINFEVNIESKTRNRGYSSLYSRRDDETKAYFPEIIVENHDEQTFTGNKVRLVVFAKDMRYKDQIKVVSASNMKSDFEGHSDIALEPDSFRLRHYEYDSHLSNYEYEYGYRYTGYAVTVKNSEGKVIYREATKPRYLNPKLFDKCKTGEVYDDKFERKLNGSRSSSSYSR
jgi:hypothetical protein